MSPPERVISHEKDEDACPYHAAPVHVARRRVRGGREELKDPEHREEAQRGDVDRVSGLAKVEARSWEGFAAESFVEDALQKSRGVQRDEDTISHFASDGNGRETYGEYHGDRHRIDRAVM
ncbi:MAG: hypothetical protein Q9194_006076 [Teloschistes cf. exilis]